MSGTGAVASVGDAFDGRPNNLNLLRLVLATAVLVSHAFPLSRGFGSPEPLSWTGLTLGEYAVIAFFALSGFLISDSFGRAPDPARFAIARAFRLVPGLALVLAVSALLVGPLVSDVGLVAYVADGRILLHVVGNLTFTNHFDELPGVFGSNPVSASVNGSLWSLRLEVYCYVLLYLAGRNRLLERQRLPLLALLVVGAQTGLRLYGLAPLLTYVVPSFATGMLIYGYRDRIPLSGAVALALFGLSYLTRGGPFHVEAIRVAIAYAAIWAALRPWRSGAAYARVGDYSYGVYVYGWTVEQLVVWSYPGIGTAGLLALALPVTFVCAAASWRFVERPAMAYGRRLRAAAAAVPLTRAKLT